MTVAAESFDRRPRSTVTSPRRAGVLVLAVALVMLAVGTLAGYVYAHEPSAPELRTRLTSIEAAPPSSTRGTLATVASDFIEVSTSAGLQRYPLAPGALVEDLAPLAGAVPEGAPVNVGGHRTESGFVITGVVVLPDGSR
jgi:hypothetical protein